MTNENIHSECKYYVGIDLGGTFIKGGIVNDRGEIIVSDKIPTESEKGSDGVAANIAALTNKLLADVNRHALPPFCKLNLRFGRPCDTMG